MIVAIFFNTYVHTLNKKKFKVSKKLIFAKIEGVKSTTFLVWQKFLADFPVGDLQNQPGETFLPSGPPTFVVLNLNQKKKKVRPIYTQVMAKFEK